MPQLLMFLPCEKVIISENVRTLSVITILDTLTVDIPAGFDIPADATIPLSWNTLTHWGRTPDDMGKHYEQRTFLLLPNGQQVAEKTAEFEVTEKAHNNIGTFLNFPVGDAGEYFLVLMLRTVGSVGAWEEIVRFPLIVAHRASTTSSDTIMQNS